MGDPLFREHGRQVAALCWRAGPQILLITSLTSKRWIIPKGWLAEGLTAAEAAAREALEEAGVTGRVANQPIGCFHYLKERKDGGGVPCSVDVFSLEVTGQLDDWPEKGAREISWLSPEDAAAKVSEPGLRQLLRDFGKTNKPSRRTG